MKILTPHDTSKFQGGGSIFIENLRKALKPFGHEIVTEGEYDILLIAGATLTDKDTVRKAHESGKKIILRVDNILEDRRNRNSGMSRLREYADLADVIVYQSYWAKRLLQEILGDGVVIHNGVDTDIFKPAVKSREVFDGKRILYIKNSRNETKQFHEVQYFWREYNLEREDDTLVLVGNFADDIVKVAHPFDFHNGEDVEYHGQVHDRKKLADIIRSCDVALLPYMYDACSNTVLEVQACGIPVIYSPTGGTPEIVQDGVEMNHSMSPVNLVRQAELLHSQEKTEMFRATASLEVMGEKYDALIRVITQLNIHEV